MAGVHELVVGLNGSGKTLYTVSTKLLPLTTATIKFKGRDIPRRLVVGGVPDLALAHELVEVPEIEPDGFEDEWGSVVRKRGDPAVRFVRREVVNQKTGAKGYIACDEDEPEAEPILWTALCWWAWCEPGDVIVLDECQRLFRPMASGRRVPKFISQLETARHYGVQFIYITQFPNLLHSNVRALVGPIEDISRVFGTSRVMVRSFDRMADFGKKGLGSSRIWKHDKKAFGLYKSSELHTKFGQRMPFAVYALVAGLVAMLAVAWVLKDRLQERFSSAKPVTVAGATGKSSTGAIVEKKVAGSGEGFSEEPSITWPMYYAAPVKVDREPYAGRALQIEGEYTIGKVRYALFGIVIDGQRVASASLADLVRMGYAWTRLGPCAGTLRFGDVERLITCRPARDQAGSPGREPYVSEATHNQNKPAAAM